MMNSCQRFFTAIMLSGAFAVTAGHALAAEPAMQKAEAPAPSKEVIMRIDKTEITRENLNNAVANIVPMLSMHKSMSPAKLKRIQKTAIEEIIYAELYYKAARDEKIDVPKKDIDAEIDALEKRMPKGQTLENILKSSNMTKAELREHYRKKLMAELVQKKKREGFAKSAATAVTEKYMKDYYAKNLAKFKLPEQIHLRSILVKADPGGGPTAWNASLKKAKDIVKMARGDKKTRPADFAELARKYSEDPNAQKGGDMGWAHRGELYEEIDGAAATMKIGEISEPVSTLYGYHVLKLEGIRPAVQKKFDELNKDTLKKELETKERMRLVAQWMKSLRDAAMIEYVAKDVKALAAEIDKEKKQEKREDAAPAAKKGAEGK